MGFAKVAEVVEACTDEIGLEIGDWSMCGFFEGRLVACLDERPKISTFGDGFAVGCLL